MCTVDGHKNITGTADVVEFATGKVAWTAEQPSWGNLILGGRWADSCCRSRAIYHRKASAERYQKMARGHPWAGRSWKAPAAGGAGGLYLRNTQGDVLGFGLAEGQ